MTHKAPLIMHHANTAFGRLVYYGPSRRTSTEVMLMLHGFGSSHDVWKPLQQAISELGLLPELDIIAVDLPGFGQSENRLGHLHSAVVGRELLDLMHRLGYTNVRVAGHSMGGFLTLDMAARYQTEMRSIHIVSGSYFTLLGMVNQPGKTLLHAPLIGAFYYVQMYLSYHDGLSGWLNRAFARRPSARTGHKPHYLLGGPAFRYGAANGIGYDADTQWGKISLPVFGAFGASDKLVTPADMHHLSRLIPTAQLTLIPGAAHSSLVEAPIETAQALFPS